MTVPTGSPLLEDLRKRLASKTPPRVVAAVGDEAFLREDVLRTVATAVLGSPDSPDLVTLRADDPTKAGAEDVLREFFAEARTGNLFGGAKVVALRDAHLVAKADEKAFLGWLAAPSSAATVVLLADEFGPAITTAAAKHCLVKCANERRSGESPDRFVVRRAGGRDKRIGADEARLLVQLVGDDLGALDNAVEVLALHAGDDPAISPASIRALFPGARAGDADEFANALIEGRIADALACASRCFDEGVPENWNSPRLVREERAVAMTLVRAFTRTLSLVHDAKGQAEAGVPRSAMKIGNLPAFLIERYARLASSRRPEALDSMVLLAEETDRGTKSGGATGRVAIARLATAVGRLK